jgi:hypothetical protein
MTPAQFKTCTQGRCGPVFSAAYDVLVNDLTPSVAAKKHSAAHQSVLNACSRIRSRDRAIRVAYVLQYVGFRA